MMVRWMLHRLNLTKPRRRLRIRVGRFPNPLHHSEPNPDSAALYGALRSQIRLMTLECPQWGHEQTFPHVTMMVRL